ncbi:MAG: hypothetical protein KDD15_25765 [Lewinella sp.]|nr:hypothetical protein [Lewinella sp.]
MEELRDVLKNYLEEHPLWDKRVSVVQVTAAKPDVMEIRLLISAANAAISGKIILKACPGPG